MFKYVKQFFKPYFDDFKHYSYVYKFWDRLVVIRCRHKVKNFIREDKCINLIIGLPRSGKTTYLAYITYIVNKANIGYRVFSNIPVLGALPYSKDDIGKYDMSKSVILLDEAGLIYDNRQFASDKQFTDESLSFLKLIGHYHSNIYLFSQSMDIDRKWVAMSKDIYFLRRGLFNKSYIYKVRRKLDVNPETHKIEDFYDKPTGLIALILRKKFNRKPYYHMFDSYSAPKLKPFPNTKKYQKYEFKKGV